MNAWRTPLPVPQLGDVVEITTPQGFAYAQFTHDIPLHEQLLRILPGLYASRPTDLAALVQQRERYVTFFWLRPALQKSRPVVTIVGQFPIPARNRAVPLFRTPALEPRELGPPPYWTLWDGQRRWRVNRLTAAQRNLPVDGMPHTVVEGRKVPEMTIVGQFEIPARNRPIPLFRLPGGPGRHPVTGKLDCWRLWDEERRWRIEGLTAAQRATGPAAAWVPHPCDVH